ncbi:nucleosidase [Granulicoccus sp. GXG6511]|uniref:nucleosidase n=1 Tax=Granulicoccus sp. GXG6511 TaxID=3381351 RepID=UPI003D7C98DC
MRPLVLVALPQEARYLPADTDLVLTGVGLTKAAVATTRAILDRAPAPEQRADLLVVNLGSVGALGPHQEDVFEPSAVINRDVDEEMLRALGFTPDNRIELGGTGPVLGSGDAFVAGGAARQALVGRCDVVDMEGFAIAYACRELGVHLRVIKHISDSADEAALAWTELADRSARALAAAYGRLFG